MAVFKVYKNDNYTVMSNYHFKERKMSLKAKGLLSLMLSLPEDWDYSIGGLVSICKENETAIKNALTELKEFGYVEVIKLTPKQTQSGRFEYIYNIYETPKQEGKKQGVENLPLENLPIENIPLYKNTNNKNTNNKVSKKVSKEVESEEKNGKKPENTDSTKLSNGENKIVSSYIDTDNKPDNKQKERKKETKKTFNEIIDEYTNNEELRMVLKEHLKIRKLKNALTDISLQLGLRTLSNIGKTESEEILIVQQSIENGWTSFYPLKQIKENYQSSYDIDEYEKYSIFDGVN